MKQAAIVVMLLLTLFSAACGSRQTETEAPTVITAPPYAASAEPQVLILAHQADENSTTHWMSVQFQSLVAEKSDGAMVVDIFPNGVLGSGTAIMTAFDNGTAQIGAGTFATVYGVFELPYLFPDLETARLVLEYQPFRALLEQRFEENGRVLLAAVPDSFRIITSNKPVYRAADLEGLRINTLSGVSNSEFWRLLGAEPQVLDTDQVYTALKQNVVEAQDRSVITTVSRGLYQVQSYVICTEHLVYYNVLSCSKAYWDTLSADSQKLLHDAARSAVSLTGVYARQVEEQAFATMEDAGLQIITLSDAAKRQMRAQTFDQLSALVREQSGDELLDALLEAVEWAQKQR